MTPDRSVEIKVSERGGFKPFKIQIELAIETKEEVRDLKLERSDGLLVVDSVGDNDYSQLLSRVLEQLGETVDIL